MLTVPFLGHDRVANCEEPEELLLRLLSPVDVVEQGLVVELERGLAPSVRAEIYATVFLKTTKKNGSSTF